MQNVQLVVEGDRYQVIDYNGQILAVGRIEDGKRTVQAAVRLPFYVREALKTKALMAGIDLQKLLEAAVSWALSEKIDRILKQPAPATLGQEYLKRRRG